MKKKVYEKYGDFPGEYFTGEPHLELCGNFRCVVDGLKSVLEYSESKIVFDIGKKSVAIHGSDLEIDYFTPQGAVVRGTIISLDFSQC